MSVPNLREVYLLPGEYSFGGPDLVIRTVLGSCVAMTLWHPRARIGGMCHFLLPERWDSRTENFSGRYCNEAILLLLREVLHAGYALREYHIKAFGGASVLTMVDTSAKGANVAESNVEALRQALHMLGVQARAEDLGGNQARTIELHNENGDVLVRNPTRLDQANLKGASAKKRRGR